MRFLLALALVLIPAAALAASDESAITGPCRPEYLLPYAEQCTFGYHGIAKDHSPANLQNAFMACDRAQTVSVSCVKSPTRQIHEVALNALYTSVAAQSEIAMFAGQYAVAESLLREKLSVIEAIGKEAQPNDRGLQAARQSTLRDIADTQAGQCTWKALATAGEQQRLLRAHAYGDLAKLLARKATVYDSCARLAATPEHRAYVEYLGYVALEESGRAAQAAGRRDDAKQTYRACIDGTARSARYAAPDVRGYLNVVRTLCVGRADGRYGVDQPQAIDADDGKTFRPLTLPKS
jgi:hypothetical protein